MFSIHSNHIVINVQYSKIMGHIHSSNSFFNYKIIYMIIVNYVYINCDKLLRETTCLPILLYKYQFCTISKLLHNVHMLHLVANSTSPYYSDLLSPLLLLSLILIPCCWLKWFPSPMGSPFKITSNTKILSISLSVAIMWRYIVVNNVKATSSFKRSLLLVSFNVKLAWSSALSQPHLEASVRRRLTLPKVGIGSPPGLLQLQSSTTERKTPRLEVLFILLERSWSVDVQNGLAWAIWTSAAQVMYKRRAGSQTGNLTPDHKKSGIDPIPTSTGGVRHGVRKLSKRATRLLKTSSHSEVWVRSYGCPKSRESNLGQFRDSSLGVPGKSAIRM